MGALDITTITSKSSTSASGFTNPIMPIPQAARVHRNPAPEFLLSSESEWAVAASTYAVAARPRKILRACDLRMTLPDSHLGGSETLGLAKRAGLRVWTGQLMEVLRPFDSSRVVNAEDAVTPSLLQARLIELGLPYLLREGE